MVIPIAKRYDWSVLTKSVFSGHIFVEVPNKKIHGNVSSGSRGETCGQTDMKKLIDYFFIAIMRSRLKTSRFIDGVRYDIYDMDVDMVYVIWMLIWCM